MAGAAIGAGQAMARLGAASLRRGGRERIPGHLRSSSKSVDFVCDHICTQCGRMEPAGPDGEGPGESPCPHCDEVSWADLRQGGVVEGLMEHDEDRRDTLEQGSIFGSAVSLSIGAVFGLFFVVSLVDLLLSLATDIEHLLPGEGGLITVFMFGAWVLFCGLVSSSMFIRASREAKAMVRETHPTRWRYAHVPVGFFAGRRRSVVGGDATLQAPFSGRACLAYSVGVRIDDQERDAAWSWSAVVQEVGPLQLDEQPAPAPLFLDLEPSSFARPTAGTAEAARVDRWLRERGIDAERLGLELFETIIRPGEDVSLRQGKDGGAVLRAR